MEGRVGLICAECDALVPPELERCPLCGAWLVGDSASHREETLFSAVGSLEGGPSHRRTPGKDAQREEDSVEQSRHYICKECMSLVLPGHRFCGACGTPVPEDAFEHPVSHYGSIQTTGKARLVVIRSPDESEGVTFILQGEEHFVGRSENADVPLSKDPFVSPEHAILFYRGERLFVRDKGSLNGVYVRIRESTRIAPGDCFICGEQVFRLDLVPKEAIAPGPDQTYLYLPPRRPSSFCVIQVLRGGIDGMIYCAKGQAIEIGRGGCDMNFPDDLYLSAKHARVEQLPDGGF
ncbi:MAG: FHA domain-containing protein, partial [Sandaracinaceae bacterium]|nr:FHA domain-containing protein [Sandaracinaceae bacterium]